MDMPTQVELMWPMLRALEGLGGSAPIHKLDERVATDMRLSDAVLGVVHGAGPRSEFAYRCAWARTRLKGIGAVDKSRRGVWAITEAGRQFRSADEMKQAGRKKQVGGHAGDCGEPVAEPRRKPKAVADASPNSGGVGTTDLLARIMQLSPGVFKKLVGEFLKAKGFEDIEVTGSSKDGGIDGHCRLSFLKISVAFQAKRWSQNVPVEPLQRLVGSISGRFERGVFVTTSEYSLAARSWLKETNPPIVALNGEEFAQQLLDLGLGVFSIPIVERRIDEGFFETLGR